MSGVGRRTRFAADAALRCAALRCAALRCACCALRSALRATHARVLFNTTLPLAPSKRARLDSSR
jgi:hypothetical protein